MRDIHGIDPTEKIVLCFDRDHTVSVNGHPKRKAVPLGWVQYWAHESPFPVWATGNQRLTEEAGIPGTEEAERAWEEVLGNEEYDFPNSEFESHWTPSRRDGLRLIRDLYNQAFPGRQIRIIVVDDVNVSDLAAEGNFTHYYPWDFVAAVEAGTARIPEPPEDSFRRNGVPFNRTETPDFQQRPQKAIAELREAYENPAWAQKRW